MNTFNLPHHFCLNNKTYNSTSFWPYQNNTFLQFGTNTSWCTFRVKRTFKKQLQGLEFPHYLQIQHRKE